MKYISIFILLSLGSTSFIFCQTNKKLKAGKYQNKRCNPIFRWIHETRMPSDNFTLYENQTYEWIGCKTISKGTWTQIKDTLVLTCISYKFKVDSWNRVGHRGVFAKCYEPLKYIIKSDHSIKAIGYRECYFLEE